MKVLQIGSRIVSKEYKISPWSRDSEVPRDSELGIVSFVFGSTSFRVSVYIVESHPRWWNLFYTVKKRRKSSFETLIKSGSNHRDQRKIRLASFL